MLEARKVIKRRPGSGSFVAYRSEQSSEQAEGAVALETGPLDHLIMRGILEPEMVRLAVINMTPREVRELESPVAEIETVRTDIAAFVRCEENFCRKIAVGTRKPLLASCYNLVIEACRLSFRAKLLRRHLTPNAFSNTSNATISWTTPSPRATWNVPSNS